MILFVAENSRYVTESPKSWRENLSEESIEMLKNLLLFALILLLFSAVLAQEETEPANASAITKMKLPAGAVRVLPSSVPAEINSGLEEIIEAGKGKVVGGNREVLAWMGGNYKKGSAPNLVKQIENNLKAQGWEYEVGARENSITFFSALRENPTRRAVLGFFVTDKDGLLLAWTEVLSADTASQNNSENETRTETEFKSETAGNTPKTEIKSAGSLNSLVGKWERKTSGMSSYKNGVYQGSSGNYESYAIYPDGRVEYTSLIAVQNYGCHLEAFGQSKGRAAVSGSQLTMNLNAGTVRRDDSCSPSKNYTNPTKATNFSYDWRVEKDEYGNVQLVLTQSDGNVYYYRRSK